MAFSGWSLLSFKRFLLLFAIEKSCKRIYFNSFLWKISERSCVAQMIRQNKGVFSQKK